jgi:hypothetical protein
VEKLLSIIVRIGIVMKPEEYKRKQNPYRYKNRYKTGEDIDMLRENNYERSRKKNEYGSTDNICDKSIDGA